MAWAAVTGPSTIITNAQRVKTSMAVSWYTLPTPLSLPMSKLSRQTSSPGPPVARQKPKGSACLAASVTGPCVAAVMAAALARRRSWPGRARRGSSAPWTWRWRIAGYGGGLRPGDSRWWARGPQGRQPFDDTGGGGVGHLGTAALLGHQGVEAAATGHAL